jgi:hypothetical protein
MHPAHTEETGDPMLRYLIPGFLLLATAAFVSAAQSASSPATQTPPPAAKPAAAQAQPTTKDSEKTKKKPKKVWTDDDVSSLGGGISVVGDSSSSSSGRTSTPSDETRQSGTAQSSEIAHYRNELRQLQAQLDVTDKKIDDLRNFKGDNTSSSGGINPSHGYTMTPVADQIKQLEAKRQQIQDRIDSVTDEARKKGIEPGDLR